MTQAKKLLSQFSPQVANHIVEFCKQLSQSQADVYIVFARKAACFVSILEDSGLLTLNGKVVSERVLDYNTDWLKDKSVVLVDDTIISGTSIYRTIQALKQIGVLSISVRVFCINAYWFENSLLESEDGENYLSKPFITLEHTATLRFCKEIVQAFSIHPRPYSTDFPIYESIILNESDLNQIESLQDWKIVGTTSQLQEDHHIRCFTLNPRREIFSAFFETLGIPIEKHSFLKLRIYAEQFEERGTKSLRYRCRVLPLVIFEPIAHSFLDKIVSAICQAERTEEPFVNSQLTTSISKLRFIQFYFAHRFFSFFISNISLLLDRQLKYQVNQREVELLFPPDLYQTINRFEYKSKITLSDETIEDSFLPSTSSGEKPTDPVNPYKITDLLMNEFLRYYYDKELEARRNVKLLKKEAFTDIKSKKSINRLNEGHTFGQLKKILTVEVPNDADRNLIISNFLDSTIDSGIVVPVTVDEGGYTSRGYRHGEEVIWGENNDKLLATFYKTFLEKSGITEIGPFWLEKTLVLFVKMGLRARILDEYTSQIAPPQDMSIMAVRSYLYGQISVRYNLRPSQQTQFNPILDYEIKAYWTSRRLQDMGVIQQQPSKNFSFNTELLYYYNQANPVDINEPDDLDPDFKSLAEEMGELIAITRTKKLLDADGLVLLTSCVTIHDCVASIAAEIYLFHENLNQVRTWLQAAVRGKWLTTNFLTKLRDPKQNPCWTAVNSGCDKFLNYKVKKGEALIAAISEQLAKDKDGSFKRRAWDRFWKKEMEEDPTKSPDLFQLNDDIGFTLLETNLLLTYLHVLIYEVIKRVGLVDRLIEGKQTEVRSRTAQCERIRKKINNLNGGNNGKAPELSFENAEKIEALETEFNQLKRILASDEREILYWQEFEQHNIERIKSYDVFFKSEGRAMTYETEKIYLITRYYQSLSNEEISIQIEQVSKNLVNSYNQCFSLLKDFSALVPQWGKINAVVRYGCIIHVNTSETGEENRAKVRKVVAQCIEEFNEKESPNEKFKSAILLRPTIHHPNSGYYIGGKGKFIIDRMTRLAARLLQECNKLNLNFQLHFFPSLDEAGLVKAFYNKGRGETDEVHDDFYPRFERLEIQMQAHEKCLLVYNTPKAKSADEYVSFIIKNTTGWVKKEQLIYKSNTGQTEELVKITLGMTPETTPITIGVITALPVEFAAVKTMLDEISPGFQKPKGDANDYAAGTIKNKNGIPVNVVVVLMKKAGTNLASAAATHLIRSFPDIEDVIMSGIAGGVPHPKQSSEHVRLGDIVISDKNGILQYDNLKDDGTTIIIRDTSSTPSANLLGLCNLLEADRHLSVTPWNDFLDAAVAKYSAFARPDESTDILTEKAVVVKHPDDVTRKPGYPKIYFGPIGSSNTLLKNEEKRNELRDKYKVKAIEMEGSGIADGTWEFSKGYLVVRGIVDYCNPDKGDAWHKYASMAAAAYTKSIIQLL